MGDPGSSPGLERCPGEGKGYPLQYSGLEISMDYSPWGRKESDKTERLSLWREPVLGSNSRYLSQFPFLLNGGGLGLL